ncbi:MAG: hypothetical protein JWM57_233, partial [Phycisphaerales bacterium]|nr:hypothetical protein [Phycisphaerales bacterium]
WEAGILPLNYARDSGSSKAMLNTGLLERLHRCAKGLARHSDDAIDLNGGMAFGTSAGPQIVWRVGTADDCVRESEAFTNNPSNSAF